MIVWVKRGDLESWISGGFIEPSDFEDSACGKRYLWSRNDIYQLAAFKLLIELDLVPIAAYEFLEQMPNIKKEVDNKIEALKRREGESFEDYKERQRGENRVLKRYLRGRLIWDSSRWGTYKRK